MFGVGDGTQYWIRSLCLVTTKTYRPMNTHNNDILYIILYEKHIWVDIYNRRSWCYSSFSDSFFPRPAHAHLRLMYHFIHASGIHLCAVFITSLCLFVFKGDASLCAFGAPNWGSSFSFASNKLTRVFLTLLCPAQAELHSVYQVPILAYCERFISILNSFLKQRL
jgi:hypothetical protein